MKPRSCKSSSVDPGRILVMDVEGFAPVGLVSGAELAESRLENSISIHTHQHFLLNISDLAHFAIEPIVLFLKALRAVTDQRTG